jgi:hypothetical protein
MENIVNVCKYNLQFIKDYNKDISKLISDPILLFPESAIVISRDHLKTDVLTYETIEQQFNSILINTGSGSQFVTCNGYIIQTIFDISMSIKILYKSLDYPVLKKNMDISDGYLIHYAKRYRDFCEPNDKIIHIPYNDTSFDKKINTSIDFKNKLNKCFWRGGCDLNGHIRHIVCNILKNSIYSDVKIYNPKYINSNISTNIRVNNDYMNNYKILLAIESVSSPADAETILFSGSIPIIIYRWWKAWFYDYVENGKDMYLIHYDELDTLPHIIEELCENEDKCLEIINNTKRFVEKIFNNNFIKEHIKNEIFNLSN